SLLRELGVDRLEAVATWLSHLGPDVLGLGNVEVVRCARVPHAELIEGSNPVPEPLTRDEDGRADVEAERVVLEGRAVPIAHEEADQAFIRLVHLLLPTGEADARGIRHGEVRGHRPVEADEAVVEDTDRVLGYHSVGRRHVGAESRATPGRYRRAPRDRAACAGTPAARCGRGR